MRRPKWSAIVMLSKRDLLKSAAGSIFAAPIGVARAEDSRPGFFAARDIAEAGFIFGLPIVMNYAVMYDFAINRDSGQFRASFNVLASDHRVFTYQDTAVVTPNSDTPYSIVTMDLRAEPLVLSVPAHRTRLRFIWPWISIG
jgi:hypothetical protein